MLFAHTLLLDSGLFTLKHLDFFPHLIFDNGIINFVDNHKHLRVTLSINYQWHTHIENIVSSATRILDVMRKLKYTISRNALNQMYMSYMLPVTEYASIVWDGCTEQDSQTLQKIQNEAAWLVIGLTRSISLKNLYKKCGWATLSQRRHQHKLSFIYNDNTSMVPSYNQDLIPPLVCEISDYPLGNNSNISVPLNRTRISQKYCIPSSERLWNSLEDNFKIMSTLPTFTKHILSKFNIAHVLPFFTKINVCPTYKVSKGAKIRDRYNQVPHLTRDTNGKVTNSQLDTTNESQEISPFPAGDYKAQINRHTQRHNKHKTEKNINDPQRSTALERSVKYLTGGLKPVSWRQPHP